MRNLTNALLFVIVELLLLFGFARPRNLAHELAEFLRHVIGVIVTAHEQLAGAIKTAAAGNALAIGAETDAEHPARHREQFRDQLGIIANLALHLAEGAIDLRNAVGAAGHNVLEFRMRRQCQYSTFERARSDRRHIVHKPLFRHFRELDAHIAAPGDNVVAFHRESRAQRPITVRPHLQDLLSRGRFDGAHGIIGAPESDELAVRRPTNTVERVIADGRRNRQLALRDIPNLDFAQSRWITASDGQPLTVRREP